MKRILLFNARPKTMRIIKVNIMAETEMPRKALTGPQEPEQNSTNPRHIKMMTQRRNSAPFSTPRRANRNVKIDGN